MFEQLGKQKMNEMMEQKPSEDPIKPPVIQEIIMSNRIGVSAISIRKGVLCGHINSYSL